MRDLVRIPTLGFWLSTATFNLAAPRFYPSCHPEQKEGSRLNHEGQLRRDPSAGPQDDIAIGLRHRPMISVDFQMHEIYSYRSAPSNFPNSRWISKIDAKVLSVSKMIAGCWLLILSATLPIAFLPTSMACPWVAYLICCPS